MATVLVVEDDKLSQRILGKILGGAGHEILVAEGVAKAWELLRAHPLVDLVILDNQLGKEWGWEFLQGLRADLIFTGLPVAVYTAHTERSSILKYVELGVQAMLVKPYKGEVLFEELKKATAVDWTGRLMERPAAACARLKISESDYYSTLSAAASALEKNIQALREAITAKREDQALREPVQQIFNQSAALGMPVLKSVTEGLVRGIGSKHNAAIQGGLRSLDSLLILLRQRSLEYMRVKEMSGGGDAPKVLKRAVSANDAVVPAAASQAATFCRRTAGSPVWAYGKGFARLEGRELFAKGELGRIAGEWVVRAPLREMVEAHTFIARAPNAAMDDVIGAVDGLPKFRELYLKIAARLGGGGVDTTPPVAVDDEPIDREAEAEAKAQALRHALDRLGVYRTMVLVAAARVAKASRVKSPLDLSMLLEHTLAVAILSYEVGRMLRLPDEHLPAAAGMVHDAGKWIFALAEPGLYALVLALAHEGGQGAARAEQGIFGATHEEAGRLALEAAHAPVLLLDAAVAHEDLARVSKPESSAVVSCLFLANHLAWAAVAADEAHAKAIRDELLKPTNQVWATLKEAGVALPLDIPELIDAMTRVSKTSAWISGELAEWAAR
jgi:CheY-like chemotaxis protein